MAILKNFDMDAFRKERARNSARGGTDLVAGLREISPEIEKLEPGQTAKLALPKNDKGEYETRKFVMAITAKLNNLTPQGGEWAGRQYKTLSDPDNGVLYVQRANDLAKKDIPVRQRRGGGGRKAASESTAETSEGAVVTEHA